MQFSIGLDDVFAQPGALLIIAQFAAVVNHALEVLIEAERVFLFVKQRAHGVGDMYLVREDDEPFVGTIPHRFIVVAKREPRENAMLIGQQQSVCTQVAAHRQTAIFIGQAWVWKP